MIGAALMVAIPFGVGQVKGDADAGFRLGIFHLETSQLIATKTTPESNEKEHCIAPASHQRAIVTRVDCFFRLSIQPVRRLF
ncbi:hypothetical protein D3C84_1191240 [compost metagenome]